MRRLKERKRPSRPGLVLLALCLLTSLPATAHPDLELQIQELTRRIADDPADAHLYFERGELHRIHEDWPSALVDYERARDLDPALDAVDLGLGKLRLEAGQPQAALAHLQRFLDRRPGHADALVQRGRALARVGDPLAAAKDFTQAIERRVEDGGRPAPELFIERARELVSAGDEHRAAALSGLEEGLDLLGWPITLEIEALEIEMALGRVDQAIHRVDRLASASRRAEWWLVQRARILESAGRLSDSKRDYRAALEAIETLPGPRKRTRAIQRLAGEAQAALDRLSRID